MLVLLKHEEYDNYSWVNHGLFVGVETALDKVVLKLQLLDQLVGYGVVFAVRRHCCDGFLRESPITALVQLRLLYVVQDVGQKAVRCIVAGPSQWSFMFNFNSPEMPCEKEGNKASLN